MSILFRKRPRRTWNEEAELPQLSTPDEDAERFPALRADESEDDDFPVLEHGPSAPASAAAASEWAGRSSWDRPRPSNPSAMPSAQPPAAAPEPSSFDPAPVAPGQPHHSPGGLFASPPEPASSTPPHSGANPASPHPGSAPAYGGATPGSAPYAGQTSVQTAPKEHAAYPASLSKAELSAAIDRIVSDELAQAHQRIKMRLLSELSEQLR